MHGRHRRESWSVICDGASKHECLSEHVRNPRHVLLVQVYHLLLVGRARECGVLEPSDDALDAADELLRLKIDALGLRSAAEREHLGQRQRCERATHLGIGC